MGTGVYFTLTLDRFTRADVPGFDAKFKEIGLWVNASQEKYLDRTKEVEIQGTFMTRVFNQVFGYSEGVDITDDLQAAESFSEADSDTTVSYSFIIPDKGATIAFTNDRTVEQSVVLKKISYDNTDGSSRDLEGATFRIYEDTAKKKPVALDGKTEFTSAEDGVFYTGKLGAGTYYLDEIVVPNGYYAPAGMYILIVDEDRVALGFTVTTGQPDLNDWITTSAAEEDEETVYTVSIRNTAGYELPSTGGSGTALIHLLGFLLTGLAGAGLMLRKRWRDAA